MTRDFIATAPADQTSGADFARSIGFKIRTPEQKLAEWESRVEQYVKLILRGCDLSEYGNPTVAEAKRRISLREGDAGCVGDPLLPRRAA
jgi:hypothetical protein